MYSVIGACYTDTVARHTLSLLLIPSGDSAEIWGWDKTQNSRIHVHNRVRSKNCMNKTHCNSSTCIVTTMYFVNQYLFLCSSPGLTYYMPTTIHDSVQGLNLELDRPVTGNIHTHTHTLIQPPPPTHTHTVLRSGQSSGKG